MYDDMYMGFEWDVANTEHVAQHQVRPDEAEQAMDDPHALSVQSYDSGGEARFSLLGATVEGRVLTVIYTWRGPLRRVVTAFPATARQQRYYTERSPEL
jgi:uncharacterized DUF497 family protein